MANWPAEAIWEAVSPRLPGFTVEVLPAIDSTNTELMRRARAGIAEPTLLVAEHQTAGRGRLGRGWVSRPGESLTFSLGLPFAPADWAGLSLAVGVAIADNLHPRIALKWPNDLWLDDRKLGGILIETASFADAPAAANRYAVIGVGVNILPRTEAGLSTPPAALSELIEGITAGEALQRIAAPLVAVVQRFADAGFEPFHARFDARDALRGRPVTLSDGTHGTAQGVTAAGALVVQAADGAREVSSSEVSVRPG